MNMATILRHQDSTRTMLTTNLYTNLTRHSPLTLSRSLPLRRRLTLTENSATNRPSLLPNRNSSKAIRARHNTRLNTGHHTTNYLANTNTQSLSPRQANLLKHITRRSLAQLQSIPKNCVSPAKLTSEILLRHHTAATVKLTIRQRLHKSTPLLATHSKLQHASLSATTLTNTQYNLLGARNLTGHQPLHEKLPTSNPRHHTTRVHQTNRPSPINSKLHVNRRDTSTSHTINLLPFNIRPPMRSTMQSTRFTKNHVTNSLIKNGTILYRKDRNATTNRQMITIISNLPRETFTNLTRMPITPMGESTRLRLTKQ